MSKGHAILLVDDDRTFRTVTYSLLVDEEYIVDVADSAEAAETKIQEKQYDLILTDLKMTGRDGLELLSFARKWSPKTPVLMVTGFASIDSAVAAMKAGAKDYLTKPCSNDELLLKIGRTIEQSQAQVELARLREEIADKYTFENIIGKSPAMQSVFKLIRQVAETDASVLIQGETGTGKELVAKAIHYNSLRKDKAFISVNCAALSENLLESELFGHEKGAFTGAIKQKQGRFELADGGTLFLDEVGDIPLTTQVKLLRAIQEREFERVGGSCTVQTDIRIISASNKDLKSAIQEKVFREDLYYRLNVMPILLTPLRHRQEDIALLAESFAQKYAVRNKKPVAGIAPAAMEILLRFEWPGNVRELENTMERAVILCNGTVIEVDHLMSLNQNKELELLRNAVQQHMTEEQVTRLYARMILEEQGGNKKETCKVLGINFRTLQNRLAF